MRVFIAGMDGYLGWSLALYLGSRGYDIAGADLLLRRKWVNEVGSYSALPVATPDVRASAFSEHFSKTLDLTIGDLCDFDFLRDQLAKFQPDTIVHFGQMPSAPYSMMDVSRCVWTQNNNITSNLNILWAMREVCPNAHLIKLGTMGEYGTPDIDIPEGFFEIEYRGRKDRLPFPRQPGSFYHLSKVHDSHNTTFACKVFGLRATDIMQGVVFGTYIEEMGEDPRLRSRLDFDQCFGTTINRFCCQTVINHPLTLYGRGDQRRGYLPLRDVMQCIDLIMQNPPAEGEYRVINQFDECYSIRELAELVRGVSYELGYNTRQLHYENPRIEAESHHYQPDREKLSNLGYQPQHDVKSELRVMLHDLAIHADRIAAKRELLIPDIRWDGSRRKSAVLYDHLGIKFDAANS